MGSWGEQFSTGDQGPRKEEFWATCYRVCPACDQEGENIKETSHCAGCRHNGDGYGTVVYDCTNCGWKTSFQYDEAGDCYYYETRTWSGQSYGRRREDSNKPRRVLRHMKCSEVAAELEKVRGEPGLAQVCLNNCVDGQVLADNGLEWLKDVLRLTPDQATAIDEYRKWHGMA